MKKLLSCLLLFISHYSFSQSSNSFAGAALVPTTSTCVAGTNSFTGHTISGATNETATITGNACTIASTLVDVWYRFTTQTEFPVITVTPTGSSWNTNLRVQILAGTALTALTERGCGSNNGGAGAVTVSPGTALTPGVIYYIRVSTTTATPTGTNWNYNICIREGTASRLGEVFKQTILSAPSILNYPWEVTYAPDNNLWVTESRGYRVRRINPTTGVSTTVLDLTSGSNWLTTYGAPAGSDTLAAINTGSWNGSPWPIGTATNPIWPQGGLAGMALHPRFGDGSGHDFVYVTYVHRYLGGGGSYGGIIFRNKLVRFTYNSTNQTLSMPAVLCDTLPGSSDHNSQRLIIAPVGGINYLFMASGDMGSGQFGNRYRPLKADKINSYEGKILRFNLLSDGDAGANAWIPNDNPYNLLLGVQSAVWNIGMRNNQGFAFDATTNTLYGASHGPYSDDEINVIEGFKHYGHPLVVGYSADGNYNGTTTYTSSTTPTTVSAGAGGTSCNISGYTPPSGYGFVSTYCGQSTAPPIGNEATNVTAINAGPNGQYKDPLFSAYAPDNATMTSTWQNPGSNANWRSEGWSGLDLYSNSKIPGWRRSLVAAGLKWGRLVKLNLNAAGTATLPSNVTGSAANEGDTVTYFQSVNRYRDLAFDPNGKDVYLVMDNSSATSGPGVGNPTVPGCQGCLIKYSFLGYVVNGGSSIGVSTIPKTIPVSNGTANAVTNCNSVTIDATNNRLWVPITGPDGNIVAEINANGNNLGTVTTSYYINGGALRTAGGVKYLDRNIAITPTNQPTLPLGNPLVKIRLYFSKAEFLILDGDISSGITSINDIKILKNGDPIVSAIASNTTLITPTNTTLADLQHGTDGYVVQADISSFSSFYFAGSNLILPVDLLTFTGSLQPNNTTLLKWKTVNEINTAHFVIERSIDGSAYSAIGTVTAAGNSTNELNYSFIDYQVANQQALVVYYRLKMVDQDDSYKYSSIVVITLADITGNVIVAPNPAENQLNINITSPGDGKVQYKLFDNSGRVVLQREMTVRKGSGNNASINISGFSRGVYYLNVSGAGLNKNILVQKL